MSNLNPKQFRDRPDEYYGTNTGGTYGIRTKARFESDFGPGASPECPIGTPGHDRHAWRDRTTGTIRRCEGYLEPHKNETDGAGGHYL